jgi:hypothetical protein
MLTDFKVPATCREKTTHVREKKEGKKETASAAQQMYKLLIQHTLIHIFTYRSINFTF